MITHMRVQKELLRATSASYVGVSTYTLQRVVLVNIETFGIEIAGEKKKKKISSSVKTSKL